MGKVLLVEGGPYCFAGAWSIQTTNAGRALLARPPARLDTEFLLTYPIFRAFHQKQNAGNDERTGDVASEQSAADEQPAQATPEEQIEVAHRSLNATLRADLLDRIRENSPAFFERLIVDLLVAMGYGGGLKKAAEQLGKSGDGSVDAVINEDRLGLDRVFVQAERYDEEIAIGRPEVQGFVGSLVGFGANKGVFVTTSTYMKGEVGYARNLPQRIVLIDGEQLTALMIEHGVGTRLYDRIEIQRLDEDFFTEM